MMIVDQGKVVEFCDEPGEFIYDTSTEPSLFYGGFGAVNKGKFCSTCGTKKPAGAKLYRCDKRGREPEAPAHPPKFCPECGDPFDDNDARS